MTGKSWVGFKLRIWRKVSHPPQPPIANCNAELESVMTAREYLVIVYGQQQELQGRSEDFKD